MSAGQAQTMAGPAREVHGRTSTSARNAPTNTNAGATIASHHVHDDSRPLEWKVNPWTERPGRCAIFVITMTLVEVALQRTGVEPLTRVALSAVLLIILGPAYLPLKLRVDDRGVTRTLVGVAETRPWDRVRRARLDSAGLWISSETRASVLDSFRGLWLPLPARPRSGSLHAHLAASLKRRLDARGLGA